MNDFLRQVVAPPVADTAEEIKFKVIGESYKPKSGRRYGSHTASAAGESFATDSGNLIRNIKITEPEITDDKVIVLVGVKNAPYAELLEREDKLNRPVWGKVAKSSKRELKRRILARKRK